MNGNEAAGLFATDSEVAGTEESEVSWDILPFSLSHRRVLPRISKSHMHGCRPEVESSS
jgi:hypothetical protein